jgi:hypothetical protein
VASTQMLFARLKLTTILHAYYMLSNIYSHQIIDPMILEPNGAARLYSRYDRLKTRPISITRGAN